MTRNKYGMLAVLLVAALALMLQGCGGDDNGVRVETVEVEVPADPEIVEVEVEVPDDSGLEGVQGKAADAAAAAKTASDNAAMAAKAAMDATANIANLQTGEMSKMMASEAKGAADMAMTAYMDAKKASEAAAAATTTEDATEAKVMAEAAQMKAEAAAKTAKEKSDGAVKYAKTELKIDGTMKMVGESSIDADMGMLTKGTAGTDRTITGLLEKADQPMRLMTGEVKGQLFVDMIGTANDKAYKQAVAADDVTIGKTLDTTDDMARLMLITSRAGAKMVRVYVEQNADTAGEAVTFTANDDLPGGPTPLDDTPVDLHIRTDNRGRTDSVHNATATGADSAFVIDADSTATTIKLKSVGMHYKATDTPTAGTATANIGSILDALDNTDMVKKDATTKKYDINEVFSYPWDHDGNTATPARTRYVVKYSSSEMPEHTTVTYRHVDITAAAAPDNADSDVFYQQVPVRAAIPAAVKYSHLHFGVWAKLGEADKRTGKQDLADLGIGFVQNFSASGMTATQLTGSATFKGDWAAAVQSAHDEDEIMLANGPATLMADFDKDEFEGMLMGLATLEGDLSGNGFSGTKVTDIEHDDLVKTATFKGTFEGGIYGPAGEEAGGIFDFSSTSGGAFRGAFGGSRPELDN